MAKNANYDNVCRLDSYTYCKLILVKSRDLLALMIMISISNSITMSEAFIPSVYLKSGKASLMQHHMSQTSCSNSVTSINTAMMIRMTKQNEGKSDPKILKDENSEISGLFGKKINDSYRSWENTNGDDLFNDSDPNRCREKNIYDDNTMVEKVKDVNILQLQKATGSEVLDMELHLQMEAARRRAVSEQSSKAKSYTTAFVNSHFPDSSPSEQYAMKMIPCQLPAPVNMAMKKRKQRSESRDETTTKKIRLNSNEKNRNMKSNSRSKSQSNTKSRRSKHFTHEEEIQLAQIIQQGAKIHKIKADFQEKHNRDITRTEWTQLAQLDSPKTLRRLVSSYRLAKNKLVSANLGLVHAVVQQGPYLKKNNGVSREELIQEGVLGLIRAAELFDPDRGLRFSTYATIWIKGVLGNTKVDEIITLPSREKTKWNKILRAQADIREMKGMGMENNEEISVKEISKITSLPIKEVQDLLFKMPRTSKMLSLDYQYKGASRSGAGDGGSTNIYGSKALEEDDLTETLQMKADIIASLARNLDPREARLMRLRYGLHDGKMRTIVECAECMGLSRQRVQQLAVKCLEKMREASDSQSLQEYLLTVA